MASGHHETNVLSFPMGESFNFLISPGAMICIVSYPPLLALISFLNFKTVLHPFHFVLTLTTPGPPY